MNLNLSAFSYKPAEVRHASRDQVIAIEQWLLEQPQAECPLEHFMCDGVYARQITIPAGVMLTGKIHKYDCINIISSGEIEVSTEHGMKRITAPFTFVSPAGTKRVGYALSDCTWTTIHKTDETDIQKIEDQLTTNCFEQYEQFKLSQQATLPQKNNKEHG